MEFAPKKFRGSFHTPWFFMVKRKDRKGGVRGYLLIETWRF